MRDAANLVRLLRRAVAVDRFYFRVTPAAGAWRCGSG